jgi:signal transduction histidine kinase
MSESQGASLTGSDARARLREQQLLLMHEADQRILDNTNTLAETLKFIVARTREILNAWHVDILLEYADELRIEFSSDPDAEIGRVIPLETSISGLVLESGQPIVVNDLPSSPLRKRYFPRVKTDPRGRVPELSFLAAEITLDGQAIGVINVEATPEHRFGEEHLDFVNAVARQISMAITHAALFDEDQFRARTDSLLMQATSQDSGLVMRQVLEEILKALNSLTFIEHDAADILFADPLDSHCLVVAYSTNNADTGVRVEINSSVCGDAFRRGRTVLLQRAVERSDYRPVVEGMRCEMAIPIFFGGSNRFPIAVLNLESSQENAFSNAGRVLAERFTRRIVNAVAMTKIRADIDSELQDQIMILAADQVLNSVHRINNHVGSIRAITRDLLEDLDSPSPLDPDDLAERLRMIEYNSEHALEIPDDLHKRIATPRESVDVNAQVEAGLKAVRIPKQIRLVKDLGPGLPNIPCTALDLVVENLVLNAIKAMRNEPGELRVTTRLDDRLEPFIVITVQDTGPGMTKQEADRLFEPRQARQDGGGLGFGMIWVRSWVRRARGLIEVHSVPKAGTTVTIRFQIEHHHLPQGGGQA